MKSLIALVLAAGISVVPMAALADSGDNASVLAVTTPLQKGTLPQIVTVYGQVGSSSSARQTMMAPTQANVTDVYVEMGQLVPQGEPLLRMVPSPSSQLAYTEAKSALRVATDLVHRTESLVRSHLATQQQLYQAQKSVEDARASLATLQAQGADGPTTIKAPFAAIVTKINTTPGAIVSEGSGLVELAKPADLVLQAGIVPNQAAKVHTGDPVVLTPIGGGAKIEGKVVFHGAIVDAANGLVPVAVTVPPGKALLGEMFRADIQVGKVQGYVVPHAAVLVNESGKTYIVQSNKLVAKKIKVTVLGSDGNQDIVSGPLLADGPVVVAGNYQLDDGMKIRLAPANGTAQQ